MFVSHIYVFQDMIVYYSIFFFFFTKSNILIKHLKKKVIIEGMDLILTDHKSFIL